MSYKNQILKIVGLAFEITENTPLHVNVDYTGLIPSVRVYIYNKSEGFEKTAKTSFTVRDGKPVLRDDLSPEAAIDYLQHLLKESEVAA